MRQNDEDSVITGGKYVLSRHEGECGVMSCSDVAGLQLVTDSVKMTAQIYRDIHSWHGLRRNRSLSETICIYGAAFMKKNEYLK